MNLYPTRSEAIEQEIRRPLAAGIEDLLYEDGVPTGVVEDYYDIGAISDETIELFVSSGVAGPTGPALYCLAPDIYPALFREICEKHARSSE